MFSLRSKKNVDTFLVKKSALSRAMSTDMFSYLSVKTWCREIKKQQQKKQLLYGYPLLPGDMISANNSSKLLCLFNFFLKILLYTFYTPPHNSGGWGIMVSRCTSVCLSVRQ